MRFEKMVTLRSQPLLAIIWYTIIAICITFKIAASSETKIKQINASNRFHPHPSSSKHYYYKMVPAIKTNTIKYYPKYRSPLTFKKVKHHHYHPIILYKKKRIPGKYWHEAQRRLVTKHGSLDILGDIIQLRDGRVLSGTFGQNIPNFNDGYFKPWELKARLQKTQQDLIKSLLKRIVKMLRERPPRGTFVVKEITMLDR